MRVRGARAISSHLKLIVMSMIVCEDSVFGFVLLVPISCCSVAVFGQNHTKFLLVHFASCLAEDLPVTSSCPLPDL